MHPQMYREIYKENKSAHQDSKPTENDEVPVL